LTLGDAARIMREAREDKSPQKRGPKGTVIWENRRKPLSGPALHRWWYRCLTRAGVVDEGTTHGKKMHGARYTSGTEFYLATGDIYATQQLLGHADVSTTANIYVQGSPADLGRSFGRSGASDRGQLFRSTVCGANYSHREIAR